MNEFLKLLLHTCCACCGSWIPDLLSLRYDQVDLYYFNPNIHPQTEYDRRLNDVNKVAEILNLRVIQGEYDPTKWFEIIKGFEKEFEGGKRCLLCFEYRLKQTAMYARENGYDCFATTLTVGRNKKADIINPIGKKISKEVGIDFLSQDFKKDGGGDESIYRSEDYGVVRQNYCGCVFSANMKHVP